MRLPTLAALLLIGGCLPPPMNVGYVAMNPSRTGGVDLSGQFGGGAEFTGPRGGGAATGHVEPFVARKVSIPIGFALGVAGPDATGFLPLRVGVRHRAVRFFAYGFGLGPSVAFSGNGADAAGVVDFEAIFGVQKRRLGFSFGMRPAFSFVDDFFTFYTLFEPQLAIRVHVLSITIGLIAGPWVNMNSDNAGGFLAAAIGLHRRF